MKVISIFGMKPITQIKDFQKKVYFKVTRSTIMFKDTSCEPPLISAHDENHNFSLMQSILYRNIRNPFWQ